MTQEQQIAQQAIAQLLSVAVNALFQIRDGAQPQPEEKKDEEQQPK